MESKNFNDILKAKEAERKTHKPEENEPIKLDDSKRVKVLSPGRLVFNRFRRNKLAIIGTAVLAFMFAFSFLAPLLYPYSQTEIFYKYDSLNVDYAMASRRTDYISYTADSSYSVDAATKNMVKVYIEDMEKNNLDSYTVGNSGYRVDRLGDRIFALVDASNDKTVSVYTTYILDSYDSKSEIGDSLKTAAYLSLYGSKQFTVDGTAYTIIREDDSYVVYKTGEEKPFALFSTFVVRRYDGADSLNFDFKEAVAGVVGEMADKGLRSSSFTYRLPTLNDKGQFVYEADGSLTYVDTKINVTLKGDSYVLNCEQVTYLIDIYDQPSLKHPFGTDGDGMDVLARMMYGGRVSLMVGFVVVLIETMLGVVMGGIAGYFGGWIDTLIMRLVDVFYCIPSLPVLIIVGAMFDVLKMKPYTRLLWMMAILGFLGWASVARLVRGQILSLREQEFMVAAESTGVKTTSKIFRHLVPNVMPQLIVTATAGLGSVILTESTLSFLGLGVKHPLATWGTMINSVSSYSSMINYTYIWVPVGLFICLTVIAFNFVGDGLRDAFDPKMKR